MNFYKNFEKGDQISFKLKDNPGTACGSYDSNGDIDLLPHQNLTGTILYLYANDTNKAHVRVEIPGVPLVFRTIIYDHSVYSLQKLQKRQPPRVILLNTTIIDSNDEVAEFRKTKLSLKEARNLIEDAETYSVVGHEATAKVMAGLLEIPVKVNRERFLFDSDDDTLLALKLDGRIPEGQVLTEEVMNTIGYSFFKIERV